MLGSDREPRRPLVLIADDVPDGREMVAAILRFHGFETAEASNGAEAIGLARSLGPAVILMDISMPGMDGFEATTILKKDPATKGIPVIVVTAYAVPDMERRAWEAGCDGFLVKPAHPVDLLATVRRVLAQ